MKILGKEIYVIYKLNYKSKQFEGLHYLTTKYYQSMNHLYPHF